MHGHGEPCFAFHANGDILVVLGEISALRGDEQRIQKAAHNCFASFGVRQLAAAFAPQLAAAPGTLLLLAASKAAASCRTPKRAYLSELLIYSDTEKAGAVKSGRQISFNEQLSHFGWRETRGVMRSFTS